MNNIYKVIWSKAKNCYVVVSEIAKSHTKSASGQSVRRSALASLLVLSFLCGGLGVAEASVHVNENTGGAYEVLTKQEVTEELNKKVSTEVADLKYATKDALNDLTTTVNGKADKTYVDNAINAAEGKIDANTTAIGDLKAKDTELEGKITTLDGKVTTDIADLKAKDTELEGKINTLNENGVKYDTAVKDKITLAGAGGTTITNLKDAALNDSSTEAVTGKQLNQTNERTAGIEYDKARDETTIGGQVTVNSIGDVTARGQLTAQGGVNAGNSDITTTGEVNAGSLNVENASHLKGDVTMDNNLTVKGDTTLKGTKVDGKLAVTDDADLKNTKVDGTLITTGKATFQEAVEMDKGLTVTNGDTKLKATTVDGKLTAGEADLKDTKVDGKLGVTGETTLEGALTAKGEAKFGENVTVEKDLTVNGKLNVGEIYLENNKLDAATGEKHDSATAITADGISNLAKVTEHGNTTESQFTHNKKGTINYAKVENSTGDWKGSTSKVTADGVSNEMTDSDGNTHTYSQTATESKEQLVNGDKSNFEKKTAEGNTISIKDKDAAGNPKSLTNKQTVDGEKTSVTNNESSSTINQGADQIRHNVTSADGKKSSIEVKADGITNTSKDGTITNDAKDIVNNATGNMTNNVGGNQTNKIDGNQENTIGGDQTTTVKGNAKEDYKKDLTTTVGGNELHEVTGTKTENVTGMVKENYSNGQETNVTGNQDIYVSENQTNTIDGNQENTIGGNQTTTVKGNVKEDYKKDLTTTVGGNELHEVTGTKTENVTGMVKENYSNGQETNVTGNQDIYVSENQTNTIDGNQENTIGGNQTTTVKGNVKEDYKKDLTTTVGGDQTTNVTGNISNKAKNITNEATDTLTDKVGENTRVITSRSITDTVGAANRMIEDGKITDNAGDFTVTTDKENGTTFTNAGSTASSFTTVDGTNTGSAQEWTNIKGNEISTGKVEANYVKMDYADVMHDLGVHGSATVDNDLTVKGITTTKTLKVTENATVGGTLDVTKKATFHDDVDIKKNLSVDGNATITGDVTARDVTAKSYKVGRNTYIDENGINANNQKITNVADGSISEGSKDAVNGGQLYGVKRDLEHQVDKVGANAAAMANLRPMEFDPSSKWNIAAAIGNYGSETAAAIGAFYRPNDNVMVNLSTAFGTGENMVGGGVSVRLGKGGNKLSREETNALKAQVADLSARMDALLSVLNPNMSKDFPDVPENHWAYEAVSRLAGNDIVQGYPDGEFHGERTMTRYEMAEIIYNALSRGAEAERKLVEEFKPELQAMAASEKSTAEKAEG